MTDTQPDGLTFVGNFLESALEGAGKAEQGASAKDAPQAKDGDDKTIAELYEEFFSSGDLMKLYEDSFEYGRGIGNTAEAGVTGWLESYMPSWSAIIIGLLAVGLILAGTWAILGGTNVTVNTTEA
jgi:hypothetical protein